MAVKKRRTRRGLKAKGLQKRIGLRIKSTSRRSGKSERDKRAGQLKARGKVNVRKGARRTPKTTRKASIFRRAGQAVRRLVRRKR